MFYFIIYYQYWHLTLLCSIKHYHMTGILVPHISLNFLDSSRISFISEYNFSKSQGIRYS